jgi:hypothetical protein
MGHISRIILHLFVRPLRGTKLLSAMLAKGKNLSFTIYQNKSCGVGKTSVHFLFRDVCRSTDCAFECFKRMARRNTLYHDLEQLDNARI